MMPLIHKLNDPGSPWAVVVESGYCAGYVDELKSLIPSRSRKWDGDAKCWLFKEDAVDTVCKLLDRWYGGYKFVGETAPASMVTTDPYTTLGLLPGAPAGLVKAAYKWHARNSHPDVGGDTATMQRINSAYEKLIGK